MGRARRLGLQLPERRQPLQYVVGLGACMRGEQPGNGRRQGRRPLAERGEPAGARGRIQVERLVEQA